ncbi:MAG: ABC transporter ATP-binding protein [Bacteroidales bacterium]|nr:ABC transporter ATP-binding protein [Bacteroidales bacterium]MDY6171268.1 ABC transporter ATP-binding protein [Candidatus Cryptobacteroides sp.]
MKWFFREIARFRWTFVAVLLFQVVGVAISLFYVWLSKDLVDTAVEHFQGDLQRQRIISLAIIFTLVSLSRPILTAIKSYMQSRMAVSMTNSLRQRLFDEMLKTEVDVGRKYHSGDMINRMESDVSAVTNAFCAAVPNLFWAGLQFAAAFACVLYVDLRLSLILVVLLPIAAPAGKFIMKKVRKLTLRIKSSDSRIQSHIQESIQHHTLLRTLEYTDGSSQMLGELQDENYSRNLKRIGFSIIARVLMSLAFTSGYLVAFLWGVRGLSTGVVTYGVMTAILQLVGQLQRPLLQASENLPSLLHCTASIDRLMELEDLPKEEAEDALMLGAPAGVRVRNLSFQYPDGEEKVIDNLSFDFKPGSRIAITGRTGIGKTTLLKLILALSRPTSGSIELYDSETSVPVSVKTRCNFAYIPQGNTLFSGTVRENLLMGDRNADEERMKEVLHLAAADFVMDLPEGLDTICSEAGGGLSEGQAQRIAVARGLLRPGSIVLLDEFSSALDPATEEEMLSRLTAKDGLCAGKTMIFITHRESILNFCDSELKFE